LPHHAIAARAALASNTYMRTEFKIVLITFKILKELVPKYLKDLVSALLPSSYNLRRNNKGILLATPTFKSKKTLGDRAFVVAAPKLWNDLPRDIRDAESIDMFKKKLKTFLFTKAFT
jgi:hypothetical protein